jgi:hypothetical protein
VRALRPGSVGVVFQSGGTFQFWLQQASLRGLDFSYAVSSGNELDLDLADYISFLVDDPHTRMIACMVEGIRRPQAFMAAAAKALAAKKPIILVKLGRSAAGQAAAQSHTGAIASDAQVFDAVCRRFGIINVPSLDDMIETCLRRAACREKPHRHGLLFGRQRAGAGLRGRPGRRMAPLTRTRAKLPASMPGSPERIRWMSADGGVRRKFAEICKVVCADRPSHRAGPDAGQSRRSLRRALPACSSPTAAFMRFRTHCTGPEVSRSSERNRRSSSSLPETVPVAGAGPLRGGTAARSGRTPAARRATRGARHVARQHGLMVPKSAWATAERRRRGRDRLPVAVKSCPRGDHKTEIGGVLLPRRRRCCRRSHDRRLPPTTPARIEGFGAEMVAGVEMIGVRRPQFGPSCWSGLVACGRGRVTSPPLLPVDGDTARDMLRSKRGAQLGNSAAGRRGTDRRARHDGLSRFSRHGRGSALEINRSCCARGRGRTFEVRRKGRNR